MGMGNGQNRVKYNHCFSGRMQQDNVTDRTNTRMATEARPAGADGRVDRRRCRKAKTPKGARPPTQGPRGPLLKRCCLPFKHQSRRLGGKEGLREGMRKRGGEGDGTGAVVEGGGWGRAPLKTVPLNPSLGHYIRFCSFVSFFLRPACSFR